MHAWSHLVNPLLTQLGSRIRAQTKGVKKTAPNSYLDNPPKSHPNNPRIVCWFRVLAGLGIWTLWILGKASRCYGSRHEICEPFKPNR